MDMDINTPASETDTEESLQTADDAAVLAVSQALIQRNAAVYEELAK